MRKTLTDIRVTSPKFEEELKTQFPILRTRKNWCHWYLIRTFSKSAFLWSLNADRTKFQYMHYDYDIVFADGYTLDTIMNVKMIGVSMRVFTNTKGKTFYIAVITAWRGEMFA